MIRSFYYEENHFLLVFLIALFSTHLYFPHGVKKISLAGGKIFNL
jgi:hypothetical protein